MLIVSNSVLGSNTLKFDDVVGVIYSEEMQIKSIGEALCNALTMESKGRKREREEGTQDITTSIKREDPSIDFER